MEKVEFQRLPGGILVACGGTRTEVKLNRPWQVEISVDAANCPFERRLQQEGENSAGDGTWRVLANSYTPHEWHVLIIPETCWPVDQVRCLGGFEQINTVLEIATSLLAEKPDDDYWLGVHVGALAGQNLSHLHFHLLRPLGESNSQAKTLNVEEWAQSSSLLLFEQSDLKVSLGGLRAGQCFVVRREKSKIDNHDLALVLDRIIRMYSKSFTSIQGLPPDYTIGIKFRSSQFLYATFVPILNNWGFTEFMGLFEGRAVILPWPHEESLRHLLSD